MNIGNIIAIVIIALFIPVVFVLLQKDIVLKKEFKDSFIIDYKNMLKFIIVIFVITALVSIMLIIAAPMPFWAYIILVVCNLVYIFFIVIISRYKLIISSDEITYTSFFAKTKCYNFNDITLIKVRKLNYGILNYQVFIGDKRIFSLSNMNKNIQEFINKARSYNIKFEDKSSAH